MKKLTLLLVVLASTIICYAENPQWMNFTDGSQINAIAEEGNTMWVGTRFGGLVSIDKTIGHPTFYNRANSGLPDNDVRSIAIDGSSTKWIGTVVGGLAAFNENGILADVKENVLSDYNVSIFPNPASFTTTIKLTKELNGKISAVDLLGNETLVWSGVAPAGDLELDVSHLSTGIYTILINNGYKTEALKMIKE